MDSALADDLNRTGMNQIIRSRCVVIVSRSPGNKVRISCSFPQPYILPLPREVSPLASATFPLSPQSIRVSPSIEIATNLDTDHR